MKKVSGYISVRALGSYEYEFFLDDNATDEDQKAIDAFNRKFSNKENKAA